ncbi:hypothetical protein LXL04_005875 [Taraxacum kok-saghyz]
MEPSSSTTSEITATGSNPAKMSSSTEASLHCAAVVRLGVFKFAAASERFCCCQGDAVACGIQILYASHTGEDVQVVENGDVEMSQFKDGNHMLF